MLGRVVAALATVLAVLAGLAGSVQVAVMARLGERVGVFAALAWAAMLTAGLAFALLLIVRQGAGGLVDAARQPVWLWSGAAMGLLIVLTITFAGSRIGVAATVAIMIAGQLAMGAVIDRYGLFGVDRVAIHWPRALGIALLAIGAALTLKR
jgi:bacterial/archaeal transporter family-2 protein